MFALFEVLFSRTHFVAVVGGVLLVVTLFVVAVVLVVRGLGRDEKDPPQ
jgi:hypothetical protein